LEHDGNGLLLAHASSWVNPNRNSQNQDEIGIQLLTALGGQKNNLGAWCCGQRYH
jgi:agmatine deiminase